MGHDRECVITLIGNPAKEALSQRFVEGMGPSLALGGLHVTRTEWLEPGVAANVFVETENLQALDAQAAAIVADQPYDAVVQSVQGRRKKLLISDMDSTCFVYSVAYS